MSGRKMAVAVTLTCAMALAAGLGTARAQAAGQTRHSEAASAASIAATPEAETSQEAMDATRREFMDVMRRHPRFLRAIQADPSLMTDQEYLNRDPALAAFFAQHPEVARDPEYFVGFPSEQSRDRSDFQMVWEGLAPFIAFFVVVIALISILRLVIGNRRWSRALKTQTDLQTRLIEKFSSNQELFTYLQTDAGKRLLEANPVLTDIGRSPSLGPPLGRIFWSFQAGLILTLAGIGLLAIRSQFDAAAGGRALLVLGTLGVTVGAGFIIATLISYLLSRRLGLLEPLAKPAGRIAGAGSAPENSL